MRRYLLIAAGLLGLLSPAKAADSTVTALTAAGALGGTELIYVVQGGADRKATPAQVDTYVRSLMGSGVSTWLNTPSSANLAAALTDKTGTGVNVFATSPTLVTPNLGTPSAATLTNATGLPVSTGITGFGTGVATQLAAAVSTAGGSTQTIAAGATALGTSAIGSGACATVLTVAAANVASTDTIMITPNASIKAVTGYAPVTTGGLQITPYPTAGNVNFDQCNPTLASITPGAVTINWRVVR